MADVPGSEFDDILVGTGGDDFYDAMGGDDILFDLGGGDVFDGGKGNDTLILDPEGQLGQHDFLTNQVFDVEVDLGNGRQSDGGIDGDSDVLKSIENYTHVGKFNMTIIGDSGGNILRTDEGMDVVRGGNGDDIIDTGSGNDILSGDAGFDLLTGGEGADRFEFKQVSNGSTDTITDFNPDEDVLAFNANLQNAGAFELKAVDSGDDVIITWGPENGSGGIEVVILENVSAAELSADNYLFDL